MENDKLIIKENFNNIFNMLNFNNTNKIPDNENDHFIEGKWYSFMQMIDYCRVCENDDDKCICSTLSLEERRKRIKKIGRVFD